MTRENFLVDSIGQEDNFHKKHYSLNAMFSPVIRKTKFSAFNLGCTRYISKPNAHTFIQCS